MRRGISEVTVAVVDRTRDGDTSPHWAGRHGRERRRAPCFGTAEGLGERRWGQVSGVRKPVSLHGSHRCSWGYSHRVRPGGLELGGQVGQKERVMRSMCRERGGGRRGGR